MFLGDFHLSPQKFPLPGGMRTDKTGPKLDNYEFLVGDWNHFLITLNDLLFLLDQVNWGNYRSSFQNSTRTGVFERYYSETINNLRNYQGDELPRFYLEDYKDWFFCTFLRTSVLPPQLNYFNEIAHEITFPILKNSVCRLNFTFNEHLDCDGDLTTLYVLGIYPSFIKINNKRVISLSYFPN